MTDAMSNKVLLQARKQLEEVEAGDDDGDALQCERTDSV